MSDPTIPSLADLPSWAEKVGWSVLSVIGLVYVLRWLAGAYLRALHERVTILESLDKAHRQELGDLRTLLLTRTDLHNQHLAQITERVTATLRDHNRTSIQMHQVLSRLVDQYPAPSPGVHPAVHRNGYEPHPSSADLPAPPRDASEVTTHRSVRP